MQDHFHMAALDPGSAHASAADLYSAVSKFSGLQNERQAISLKSHAQFISKLYGSLARFMGN